MIIRKKNIQIKFLTRERLITVLIISLIFCAGFFTYANSSKNEFVWDDHYLIENNIFIKNWGHLKEIFTTHLFYGGGGKSNFYRPLQSLSLILDYSIWRLNPFGYHLTNIILHTLTALLVYFLLYEITKSRKISLFSSLFFVVHPIQTEAVTYISGRADSLSSIFLLLSLLTYINYYNNKNLTFYITAVISFVCALLSKENSLILPLLIFMYIFTFKEKAGKQFFKLFPFLLIALIYIFIRLKMLNFHTVVPTELKFPLASRLMTTAKAIFIYLSLLIFPINLHMERYVAISKTIFEPLTFLAILGIVFIFIITFKSFSRSKVIFFSIMWFFVNLIPYSNIVQLSAFISEHWIYLSSIGFFVIFTVLISKLLKNTGNYLLSAILIMYGLTSVVQNGFWKNDLILYQRISKFFNPYTTRPYYNLGKTYARLGLYNDAISEFSKIIKVRPKYTDVYNEIGLAYFNKKELNCAIEQYKKALELKPDYAEARYNLGRAYEKAGQFDMAKNEYTQALKLDSKYARAYASLADLCQQLENDNTAIDNYNKALSLDPNLLEVYINLGALYERKAMLNQSLNIYKKCLQFYPQSAELHYNLGLGYKKQNLYDNAIKEYKNAIKLNPNYAEAYGNLGVVYAKKGFIAKAREAIRKSLEINPANETMKQNLDKLEKLKQRE